MKVLLLGATGGVGKQVLSQGLRRGHELTALVRSPEKIQAYTDRVRIIEGDVLNPSIVDEAVGGQDAVIYAVGVKNIGPTTLFSDSTRILIPAMTRRAVRRLICITGIGAGETKGHGGFVYDRFIYPFFTKNRYLDKERQEALIRSSGLDWVIVRPARFVEGSARGGLEVVTDLHNVTLTRISRAEAAAFVLDQLTDNRYLHQTPFIGHR